MYLNLKSYIRDTHLQHQDGEGGNACNFLRANEIFSIGFFVLPLMIIQFLVSILNLIGNNDWFNFTVVSSTWISTFLISAPIHSKLKKIGKSDKIIDQLIKTNWIRVILWTTLLVTR